MPVVLHEEKKDDSIPVGDMNFGEIGLTVKWFGSVEYLGMIVTRNEKGLHQVGGKSFWSCPPNGPEFRVRILPPGTLLRVE